MTGRRRHKRLSANNAQGILRLSTDVVIQASSDHEVIAVCSQGYAVGERLVIEMVADRTKRAVTVADSRPVIVDGCVQHKVRLIFAE